MLYIMFSCTKLPQFAITLTAPQAFVSDQKRRLMRARSLLIMRAVWTHVIPQSVVSVYVDKEYCSKVVTGDDLAIQYGDEFC